MTVVMVMVSVVVVVVAVAAMMTNKKPLYENRAGVCECMRDTMFILKYILYKRQI